MRDAGCDNAPVEGTKETLFHASLEMNEAPKLLDDYLKFVRFNIYKTQDCVLFRNSSHSVFKHLFESAFIQATTERLF